MPFESNNEHNMFTVLIFPEAHGLFDFMCNFDIQFSKHECLLV